VGPERYPAKDTDESIPGYSEEGTDTPLDAKEEDLYKPLSPEAEKAARRLTMKDATGPGDKTNVQDPSGVTAIDTAGKIELSLNITKALPNLPVAPDTDHSLADVMSLSSPEDCPPLNIVIFIVGSRGMTFWNGPQELRLIF